MENWRATWPPRRRWWPDEIGPRKRAWKSGKKRTRGWGWWGMDLLWIKLKLRIWGISYRKTVSPKCVAKSSARTQNVIPKLTTRHTSYWQQKSSKRAARQTSTGVEPARICARKNVECVAPQHNHSRSSIACVVDYRWFLFLFSACIAATTKSLQLHRHQSMLFWSREWIPTALVLVCADFTILFHRSKERQLVQRRSNNAAFLLVDLRRGSFDFSWCQWVFHRVLRTRENGCSWMRFQLVYAFEKSAYNLLWSTKRPYIPNAVCVVSVLWCCSCWRLAWFCVFLVFSCRALAGFLVISCWVPSVFWVVLQLKVASKNTLNTFTQE